MSTLTIGTTTNLKGCVTQRGFLKGKNLSDMERLLGFSSGRLKQGAFICELLQLPAKDQFKLAGYTQVATHRTNEQYGKIPLDMNVVYKNLMQEWSTGGNKSLVKVIPVTQHNPSLSDDEQYPPGQGIPQWVLTAPLPFKVVAHLTGGQRY